MKYILFLLKMQLSKRKMAKMVLFLNSIQVQKLLKQALRWCAGE